VEEKALLAAWEAEHKRSAAVLLRGKGKIKLTTTREAAEAGRRVQVLKGLKDAKIWGAIGRYNAGVEEESFKDVPTMHEFFGSDWDMMNRVAADPAHEFHNLVKDLLGLICNKGKMSLKTKHLDAEHKRARFKHIQTPGEAPWTASKQSLEDAHDVIAATILKIPHGWPTMVNYFGEDIKNGACVYM
jgi:hypothetical protein